MVLLVAFAVFALVLQSQRHTNAEAKRRSIAVAQTFAHSPGVLTALQAPDPSKVLQPLTEAGRKSAGVDFVVVMDTKGIRYTHPLPDRIGKQFVGKIQPSLAGKVYTESVHGPLGREVQATVPIRNDQQQVVALVSAGLKVKNVTSLVDRQIPIILTAGAGALGAATAATVLVGRRLRRRLTVWLPTRWRACTSTTTRCCTPCAKGCSSSTSRGACCWRTTRPGDCWNCLGRRGEARVPAVEPGA